MKRLINLTLLLTITILTFGQDQQNDQKYIIKEANLQLNLANMNWSLASKNKVVEDLTQYIFKRSKLIDSNGDESMPTILILVQDASSFSQNIEKYSNAKNKEYVKMGIKIEEILNNKNENFPLSYKNAYFIKSTYDIGKGEHIFYMIQIINDDNIGIQICLDMRKDISEKYESELWTTIKSIKEQ